MPLSSPSSSFVMTTRKQNKLTALTPLQWMANLNICDYSFLVGIHSLASDDSMVVQSPATRR